MTHILIIDSRFYEDISDLLVSGAVEELEKNGATYEQVSITGAFETPAVISFALKTNKYDGFIALGCVIRGETSHYDYVCSESARGLNQLAIEENAAIGYGILTVENRDQAIKRAKDDNKGGFAAKTCLQMIELKKHFGLVG